VTAKKVEKIRGVDFIWMDGQLIPWGEAKVHVLTHSLHYGVAVFEAIRSPTAGARSSGCASTSGGSSSRRTSA